MLNFFHGSGEFFNIKELETTGSKKIGVSSMQIKGLLKALTDNSLVRVEKIGSGNYYWAFPSDSNCSKANRIEILREKAAGIAADIEKVTVQIDEAQLEREALVYSRGCDGRMD